MLLLDHLFWVTPPEVENPQRRDGMALIPSILGKADLKRNWQLLLGCQASKFLVTYPASVPPCGHNPVSGVTEVANNLFTWPNIQASVRNVGYAPGRNETILPPDRFQLDPDPQDSNLENRLQPKSVVGEFLLTFQWVVLP